MAWRPGSSASSSPSMSPSHRAGGISGRSTLRKQNAAEMLAKVMQKRDSDYDYDDEDGDEDLYQVNLPPLIQARRRDDKRIGMGSVNGKKAPAKKPVILPPPRFDDESDDDGITANVLRNPVIVPRNNARDRKEAPTVKPAILPPRFDDEHDGDEITANASWNPVEIRGQVSGDVAPAVKLVALQPHFDEELDGDEITADKPQNTVEAPQNFGKGALKVRVPAYSRRNPIENFEQNGDGKPNVQFDAPAKQSESQLNYKKR